LELSKTNILKLFIKLFQHHDIKKYNLSKSISTLQHFSVIESTLFSSLHQKFTFEELIHNICLNINNPKFVQFITNLDRFPKFSQ
jgi:hypothetical protein